MTDDSRNRPLDGKVALVTGAASGIGKASARRFVEAGASVALVDIDVGHGQAVAAELGESGDVAFFQADVSKSAEIDAVVRETVSRFGGLDCAHNNAGIIGGGGPVADLDEATWERTISVNLTGVFLCMKYEIPAMLKRGGGSIVNTSSRAGLVGVSYIAPYVASKHAVCGLTKTAAIEYGKDNIRVNAVCPGPIRTGMTGDDQAEEMTQGLVANRPLPRMGRPDEVADAVIWLCSDPASFVTGHMLAVDGGSLVI